MIIGNTASEKQENVVVNEGNNDEDFTVGTSNVSSIINEIVLNVKTLESCFNERIDREMENIVETVEDRIQSAILTAIDNIVGPKIELAIRSINASSGRDVASMSANSERREHTGINASFENASENNNTIGVTNINDEARRNSQDGVSELSVPGTQFDRQSHIHHVVRGVKERHTMLAGGLEQIHNPHHMMTEPSNETHHIWGLVDLLHVISFLRTFLKTSFQKRVLSSTDCMTSHLTFCFNFRLHFNDFVFPNFFSETRAS